MSTKFIDLNVTSISQFVRLQNCERFLRFRLFPKEAYAYLKRWDLKIQPLTPLLQDSGLEFEKDIVKELKRRGETVIDLEAGDEKGTARWLREFDQPIVLFQPHLSANIGNYECHGIGDLIRLKRKADGAITAHVADVKASRKPKMEHCLQVALYVQVLTSMAETEGQSITECIGTVMHIQEDGSLPEMDENAGRVDLDTYDAILERLILDENCLVDRVAAAGPDEAFYHLNYKCDGCLYNAICMYDSAERLDLSLISTLTAAEKRAFLSSGVSQIHQLAQLMDLPQRGSGIYELSVAAPQRDLYQELSSQWSLAPKLPMLVQKAKASARNFDKEMASTPFLFNSGFGTLPADDDHPELIKIFVDAQKDYLQDRIYLISTLITGPSGERVYVEATDAPPGDEDEANLLIKWLKSVLQGLLDVTPGSQAPIHIYCYDRLDQLILLEALKRHLDAVASIPGFFDLMTQSPALEQPIISFLADELRDRLNLGLTCMPLHDAARKRGFDWQDGEYEFFSLFRARLFDNRRNVIKVEDGRIEPNGKKENALELPVQRIESASRFNSQIPLEYVYAAWGRLPDIKEGRHLLDPFRKVDLDALRAFAIHRVRALAHIEQSFGSKCRFMNKPPLNIPEIVEDHLRDRSLAKSLQDFLFIEHHTSYQAKEMTYSLPIEQRVQTGLALLLHYLEEDPATGFHRFSLAYEELGLDPVLTMNACRLKENAWVVLNPIEPAPSAGRLKNGRIAVIKSVDEREIVLDLLSATFYGSSFRYPHENKLTPQAGQLYSIDEMADDLNADKALDALGQANANVLYQWMVEAPDKRELSRERREFLAQFTGLINQVMGKKKLTKPQQKVIVDDAEERLLLIQGPPGTGKSVTLAWAIISRMAEKAAKDEPFRVAVCCKTHNAVKVVLEALAERIHSLSGFALQQLGLDKLQNLSVFKLVNELDEVLPAGVTPFKSFGSSGPDIRGLLDQPWLIIGGTPGGIYNLRRYEAGRKADLDWAQKSFDLVVIDEASQISVPESVLGSAFLKHEGDMIVVGDHRQMPPIVAHDWDAEEQRNIVEHQPYISLFEFLRERGFHCEGLDQSFRLHEVIAQFLHENIYRFDGIRFFSRRKDLLSQPPSVDEYVDVVLDPAYPIVVVEHDEAGSQQYNETEIELAAPLIDVCAHRLRLDGLDGIGVVVPHRAQRAMLKSRFPDLAATDSIDTVERFQGGERDVIIVSATASDPDYVLAEASFLLNLNRLNVALSRPRMKLIVIASRSVVDLLTSDLNVFENAVIWKRLYHRYADQVLYRGKYNGTGILVKGKRAG